jgi:outer membrane protein OmpA-like peptidoglycan-associated protein
MKSWLLYLCLFLSFGIKGQNTSCEFAIEMTDSMLISDCAIKELWFKFRPSDKKYIINILSADSLAPIDYILYKDSPDFCSKLALDTLLPVAVSFHHGPHEYEGLTLEEIAGNCCCNSCELRERFLSLKKDSLYYLRIFPRGKSVLLKKDYNKSKKKVSDSEYGTIAVGKTITISNIYFHPESDDFLPSSKAGLDKLFLFLDSHPKISIEIQGHVNAPGKTNAPENNRLSESRARSVMNYLIKRGIPSSRLKAIGYGNTRMIFPDPKNNEEMMKNRRVEVLITKM